MNDAVRIMIAVAKRFMAAPDTPSDFTFRVLRYFERFSAERQGNTPLLDASEIAAIEPMSDEGYELYREIAKLVPKRAAPVDMVQRVRDHEPAWKAMADNYAAFAAVNPSLRAQASEAGQGFAS